MKRVDYYDLFFKDLPPIDYERADTLLAEGSKNGEIEVPDNWPANWPWLIALRDAVGKINEHEQAAARLRLSAGAFREMFLHGDPWPGMPSK